MHLIIIGLNLWFCKKQVSHVHAQTLQYTYAHHAHTHTTHMHARVYECTHCDHKGHLEKFYFDRINSLKLANNNVWVPFVCKPREPNKRIWAQKFSPLVFDVGVGSHKT